MRWNNPLVRIAAIAFCLAGAFACFSGGGDDDDVRPEETDDDNSLIDGEGDDDDWWDGGCWEMPPDPDFPDGHYYKCDDDWWDDDWWDDDSVDDDSIDDDSADDDSADDDTGGDDDTESQCALGIEFAYDCGWALTGDEGDLSVAESTAECEAGNQLAVCLANCGYTASNCQQVDACVEANC